ncbi:MAG TPA: GntR family transcriptional regulator [Gaiellaceae bacterium]|nr:GntR family transcriptional regulator [Gaiellaceae bacterium]
MSASEQTATFLTKTDYAYSELRRRILDGELAPGSRMLLRPLAEELGISVMPVRDAIRLLDRDGLVTSESHRGATVTTISRDAIIDAISIRMWLEILAIREATPLHTKETIAAAEHALLEAERAAATGQGLAYTHANRAVHEALEAPASAALRQLIDETWDRLWQARRRMSLFVLAASRIVGAETEHRALFESVRRGDVEAAADAMARHRDSTLVAWDAVLDDHRDS